MGLPVCARRYTAEELAGFPEDGNRYEVLDGELLVTPAPSRGHQGLQMELILLLGPYVRSLGLDIMAAPTAVRASHVTELQPDLLVLPRNYAGRRDFEWERMSALVLAIEILSPRSIRVDRVRKRDAYLANGVAEYWIVDPDSRSVEVWRQGGAQADTVCDALSWQPIATGDAIRIDLPSLFGSALDE